MTACLEARGLTVGYGSLTVARDLHLRVEPGKVVLILGPNGVGKTTTLLTLAGALPALAGETSFLGAPTRARLHRRARQGLAFVPDERGAITRLTVDENLRLGLGDRDRAYELFPELRTLRGRRAGLLSGGEQKMLALALALSGDPAVLLADELSMGLAPQIVTRLLDVIRRRADGGLAVLLVEQHALQALAIADHVVVMAQGGIQMSGPVAEIRDDLERILEAGYMAKRDER